MWTADFWRAVAERALKTFAQAAAAMLIAAGTGLLEADWVTVASVAGMAAVVSVLTSIGSGAVTDGSPSLTNAETLPVLDGEVSEYLPESEAEDE